ncbi:hypothetical protein EDD99_7967 [Streptomyces sp. 846.5]|nr:hypothetical protein EDD99_7967 [Streptomyces sp. 846.5]
MRKRKKSSSRNVKSVVHQRNAQNGRVRAVAIPAALGLDEFGGEHQEDDVWDEFLRVYPTPAAAVEAATAGRQVEVQSDNGSHAHHRAVRVDATGSFVQDTYYVPLHVQQLLVTVLLNNPEAPGMADVLRDLLWELLPVAARGEHIEAIQEPSKGTLPRFGYRITVPAAGLEEWGDLRERLEDLSGPLLEAIEGSSFAGTEADELFRASGFAVVRCQLCGIYLTNRHPVWPGVWITLDTEFGPICLQGGEADPLFNEDKLVRLPVSSPHVPLRSETG